MRPIHVLQLICLSFIGGFGFIFMRIAAPFMSAAWLVELRLLVALPIFLIALRLSGEALQLKTHWRTYTVLGLLNICVPFGVSSWAAKSLYASLLSIINATAPLFGALIGLLWLKLRPSTLQALGVIAGLLGVVVLMDNGSAAVPLSSAHMLIVLVAMLAPISFGLGTTYANAAQSTATPRQIATGSALMSALIMLPFLPATQMPANVTLTVVGAVVAAGVFNTAANFLLFYNLAQAAGPTPALAVNYLVPLTGILFSVMLLSEPVPPSLLSGAALALVGTLFATNTHRLVLNALRKKAN